MELNQSFVFWQWLEGSSNYLKMTGHRFVPSMQQVSYGVYILDFYVPWNGGL
jgi:hypothetical protein